MLVAKSTSPRVQTSVESTSPVQSSLKASMANPAANSPVPMPMVTGPDRRRVSRVSRAVEPSTTTALKDMRKPKIAAPCAPKNSEV